MRCYRCQGSVITRPNLLPDGTWESVNKCVSCGREQEHGEEKMAIPKRICRREGCGKEYQPTSNVQKFCPECSVIAREERNSRYLKPGQASKIGAAVKGIAQEVPAVKPKDRKPRLVLAETFPCPSCGAQLRIEQ